MRLPDAVRTGRRWLAASLAGVLLAMPAMPAQAAQLPAPGSNLFIQTSGPGAGLGIGDYHTSPAGGNTDHLFLVRVPSNWPAGETVTIALYDPEIAGPDPGSPPAADEIRGSADTSTFTLSAPNGSTIATRTYADATTNGSWAHLVTFDPGTTGTGNYELHVTVTGDDDNSWRVDASHDPDCVVGGPDTCGDVVDGDETDTAPSGSGAIGLGTLRTSYQHGSGGQSCQDHVFYIDSSVPRPLRAHNFDMDNNGSVTYIDPNGVSASGTVSANARWNNSSDATRVGDVLADVNGWWTATLCISNQNQYVFEAPGVSPTFPVPQPTPRIEVAKDDSTATASIGDQLAYAIDVTNVSDGDALPGEAYEVELVDELPDGVSFVSCDAPTGVTCTESDRTVTAVFGSALLPGETVSLVVNTAIDVDAPVSVENTVVVSYDDQLGNSLPDETAADTTEIDFAPTLEVTASGPDSLLRGASSVLTFDVTHDGDSDGSPVGGLTVVCPVCTATAFIAGDDDGDGLLDQGETWSYEGSIATDGATADPLAVVVDADGVDREDDPVSTQATHPLDLVEPGTIQGTVFEDLNGNGLHDAGEPGIDDADVSLLGGSSTLATVSPASGEFSFTHLFPGGYDVSVDEAALPSGILPTNSVSTLTLTEGGSVTGVDFGYAMPVTISGNVYGDADFDGISGDGEMGVSSVRVALLDPAGETVAETLTDAAGDYFFVTLPGDYSIRVVGGLPGGWAFTTDEVLNLGLVASGESVVVEGIGVANQPPVLTQSTQTISEGETPTALPSTDVEGGVVTFAIVEGSLPSGLVLNSDGTFAGVGQVDGVYNLDLRLCDDGSPSACATYQWQLNVLQPNPVDVGVTELPFTGVDAAPLAVLAFLLLGGGLGVIRMGERLGES